MDHIIYLSLLGKRFLDVKVKLSMAPGKCVSEDRGTFQNVMDVFREYEIKVSEPIYV